MCQAWQLGQLLVSLTLAVSLATEPAENGVGFAGQAAIDHMSTGIARLLADAGSAKPTIDEVDSVIFSRPPHSNEKTSSIVYGATAGICVLCLIILLIAANLDASEKRKRRARAIVPEESVPCAIAEQYYLDESLVKLRSSQDFEARKQRKGFCSFLLHYSIVFPDMFSRQHLGLSLVVQAIPTFTRLKRGILIVVQLHLCMLTSSFAYNIFEHDKPNGRYEMVSCSGNLVTASCTATLPMSLLAAAAAYPVFRFVVCRQIRLTCFASQSHPSTSQFHLNVRKFARIPAKSAWESIFCMRNAFERRQVQVLQSRSFAHRVVQMLWRTTQPSAKDLRFYGVFTSWCILLLMLLFTGFTLFYVINYTAYLEDDVVYHWLAWTLMMFFSSVFVLEPAQIFFVEVVWNSLVANLARRWSFGAHALAGTTRYKEVVRDVEKKFIKNIREVAVTRVQRWWKAVLEMYRAINEQTSVAVNFQAITKKTIYQKQYAKVRKWCLRVEVQECYDLEQVQAEDLMSPLIRLQCDVGNPSILQTKVQWDAHKRATFNETFFIDIKESQALYVTVWSKTPTTDEFIGRGYFDFAQLKSGDSSKPEGQDIKVTLHDIEHGEKRSRMNKVRGYANLRVNFIDPAKEPIAGQSAMGEDTEWMLPKHRMQFALTKMGGRMKVSKMLGGLGTPMLATVPVKVPSGPVKLDTGGWQVDGQNPESRLPTPSQEGFIYRSAAYDPTPAFGAEPATAPMSAYAADTAPSLAAPPLPPPSAPPPAETAAMSLNSAVEAGRQPLPGQPLPSATARPDGGYDDDGA